MKSFDPIWTDPDAEKRGIVEGILRVEANNVRTPDQNGPYPSCKNKLGTYECERCGNDVRTREGACPAVPPEQRWSSGT